MVLDCLWCGETLTSETVSREHVIPNALGGLLRTTKATCKKCNAVAGEDIDGHLAAVFNGLSVAFDVLRDRGDHPNYYAHDDSTGDKYVVQPGKEPILSTSLKVNREGNNIVFNFNAPTRQEAERLYEKFTSHKKGGKAKKLRPPKFEGRVRHGEKYSFSLAEVSYVDQRLLRAIAKMAACYARHCGLTLPSSAQIMQFVRGEATEPRLVSPVLHDLVVIDESCDKPLRHGLFLFRSDKQLFAYIVLFQVYEFVVLVDNEQCVWAELDELHGHMVNIITGCVEKRPFVLADSNVNAWFGGESQPFGQRFRNREAPFIYWLQHKTHLWLNRAVGQAAATYARHLDEGVDELTAVARAAATTQRLLARYEMDLGDIQITGTQEIKVSLKVTDRKTRSQRTPRSSEAGTDDLLV